MTRLPIVVDRAQFNTGGPMSRQRTERLQYSIFQGGGALRLPLCLYVGLEFPKRVDPVEAILEVMTLCGYGSPGEARLALADRLPARMMAALPCQRSARCTVGEDDARFVLEQALVLGLSTARVYDPSRPVLWTRASLTRRLELYDLGGFYAAD
jgi:hypothetical protein